MDNRGYAFNPERFSQAFSSYSCTSGSLLDSQRRSSMLLMRAKRAFRSPIFGVPTYKCSLLLFIRYWQKVQRLPALSQMF